MAAKIAQLFLDCEFTGLVREAELISLCLYRTEKSYFYAEFNDYDLQRLSEWHRTNVLNKLFYGKQSRLNECTAAIVRIKDSKSKIAEELKQWLAQFKNIEVWGDVPAYDWMLFCDLFSGALNIPKQIHYICGDIATLLMARGMDKNVSRAEFVKELLPQETVGQHNSFFDARVAKLCYQKLTANE